MAQVVRVWSRMLTEGAEIVRRPLALVEFNLGGEAKESTAGDCP
jgi:hypothetical protein